MLRNYVKYSNYYYLRANKAYCNVQKHRIVYQIRVLRLKQQLITRIFHLSYYLLHRETQQDGI